MIPVLILAAGQSTRMRGRDKLLEPVAGQPLLRRIALAAQDAGLDPWIALPGPDHPRVGALAGLAHRPLHLPGSAEGMGGTLREGVAALPRCARFMILLADLPEITAAHIGAVLAASDGDATNLIWRGATQALEPGHPILLDASLRPAFARLKGDDGGRSLMAAHRGRTALVPLPGRSARRDLDTPEDWAAWRAETE